MTANALRGDRELCLDAGMDDYIAKPFDKEQFLKVLMEWHSSTNVINMENEAEEEKKNQLELSVFNARALEEVLEDKEVVQEVIQEYLHSAPVIIGKLESAAKNQDYKEIREYAHALKGSSRTIRSEHLADLCQNIETKAKMLDSNGLDPFIRELQNQYEYLEAKLRNYINRNAA